MVEVDLNYKVQVNSETSETIQNALFSVGYKWNTGGLRIDHTNAPYLFISEKDKTITYSLGYEQFVSNPYKEITVDELLKRLGYIFKPFKNKKECYDEMINHYPFGWVKTAFDENYVVIELLDEEGIKTQLYSLSYEESFVLLKFLDNTPFGKKCQHT